MISPDLLAATNGRALGLVVYGGPGLRKTLGAHTLPAPVLFHDFEDNTVPLLPWIRRTRQSNTKEWLNFSQEQRESFYDRLDKVKKSEGATLYGIRPLPLVDVIHYDGLNPESWTHLAQNVGTFSPQDYNSEVIDSLNEMSFDAQTFSKSQGRVDILDPMIVKLWAGAQERMKIILRQLRSRRGQGVFVYITSGEHIEKDYVTDPRESKSGRPEEPYSVKGTIRVPGQLTEDMQHVCNIMLRAKTMMGEPHWVSKRESLPGGSAHWETKDSTGRLPDYVKPNWRTVFDYIYGEEGRKAIYASALAQVKEVVA